MEQQRESGDTFPVIDTGKCSLCQGCVAVAPDIFFLDENTGRMSVVNHDSYPESMVEEAIRNCPKDCISWEQPIAVTRTTDFTEEEILGIG